MGVAILLPGYDAASQKPTQVWTNGGEWYEITKTPLSWELICGVAADAGKKCDFAHAEIPLETVAAEVARRFPGKWQGEFKLDALGVRFWDETADCPTGCQVKPDGMLCFTGTKGFVYWREIFGIDWTNEQRALHLGRAAGDTYFDGRGYWQCVGGVWRSV